MMVVKTPCDIKNELVEAITEVSWVVESGDAHDLQDACDLAHESMDDALAYIKQLEAERDAAVADIEESQPCFACKNFKRNSGNCGGGKRCLRLAEIAMRNGGTYKGKFFEWRGVQKEDSND